MAVDTAEIDPVRGSQAQEKISIARQKKDQGDQAFKAQDFKAALRWYHEAMMYLQGIDKQSLPGLSMPSVPAAPDAGAKTPRTEADDLIETVYSNMSACHIKGENWRRAIDCADRALQKNPDNYKSAFRKGKAQAELGYIERAEKTLEELKTKNPADAATIDAELARIRAADAERQKKHNQKFRGFLSRDKPAQPSPSSPAPTSTAAATATPIVKSSIPAKPTPEEDGDGSSRNQPILVPSGIEELDDEDEDGNE